MKFPSIRHGGNTIAYTIKYGTPFNGKMIKVNCKMEPVSKPRRGRPPGIKNKAKPNLENLLYGKHLQTSATTIQPFSSTSSNRNTGFTQHTLFSQMECTFF